MRACRSCARLRIALSTAGQYFIWSGVSCKAALTRSIRKSVRVFQSATLIRLARSKTSGGGSVHQIAQLIWTIEKVAVSGARLLRRQVELIDIQLEQINEVGAERRFSGLICNRVHGHLPTRRKLLMMIMGGRAVALPDGCQAGIRAANTTNNASTLKVSVGPQISCAYFGIAASRNSEFIRNHLSLRSHSICEAVHTPCVSRREIDKNVMPVTSWSWRLGFQHNEGSVGHITCPLLAHNSALGG